MCVYLFATRHQNVSSMEYHTFEPHPELQSIVKCHWTLEVPAQQDVPRQRVVPDGFIEMFFILGDDVKRYTAADEFIIQPREMVLGQITGPLYVQPTGYVKTFAVRFYPYGFACLVNMDLRELANKETPLAALFGEETSQLLKEKIGAASGTEERIEVIEAFLLSRLRDKAIVDAIVKATIDAIFATNGSTSIKTLIKDDPSKRRQLERKFIRQIGVSPKQLGKVIRLQAALKLLLSEESESVTRIAYESEYYDQAHFLKDFREFTGTTPKAFLKDGEMQLSSLFYK